MNFLSGLFWQKNSAGDPIRFWKKNQSFFGLILLSVIIIALLVLFFVRDNGYSKLKLSTSVSGAGEAFNAGDFVKAREGYQEALEDDPKNPNILASLITTIASQGNQAGVESQSRAQAQEYVDRALRDGNKNKNVLTAVGYFYETNGDYEKALDYYSQALVVDPKCAQCFFHKGHTLLFLDKPKESKDAYEQGYKLDPNNPQILIELGRVKFNDGDFDGAVKFFMEASEAATNAVIKADALVSASNIKRTQGYVMEALELSSEAMALNGNSSQILSSHGFNLAVNGKLQEGVDALYQATKVNPRSVKSYWWMGQVLRAAREYQEAINYLKMGIEKVDNDNTILGAGAKKQVKAQMTYDVAKTYSMEGNDQESLNVLKQAVNMHDSVRIVLKQDIKNGFFKSLENDVNFQSLIR